MKQNNSDIYLYRHNPHKNSDFHIRLAFPGPESFALASLGFLWLYKTLDEAEDIDVEPVYSDTKLTAIRRKNVDLFGFSFNFDMDIFNIFQIIEQHGFALKSSGRGEDAPLIFAGGPVVTANPKPYKDFFDFFIIGDGENLNLTVARLCGENKNKPKAEVLKLLAELDGVYVPSAGQKSVKKVTNRLNDCIYTPIISGKSFFKNTFIVELERGCANCCGFCLASYLNLPVRFTPYEQIISTLEMGLKYTRKIALLGAQITAHPQFKDICRYIYDKIQSGQDIGMSVSSMRVDAFCADIVKTLAAAGQKNTTLAIEAGSERLRKVINKNLTEDQIFKAVDTACENGLKGFKFYGMIGIPTETYGDLDAMIALAHKIKTKSKGFDITFGFSSFVPKPDTPFQWCGRENTKSLEKKTEYMKKEFHKIGVKAQFASIKWDYWQAVLSRGDETFTEFLIEAYRNQTTLGALKAAAKGRIDPDYYAARNYDYDEALPWDFIEIPPGKEFLKKESRRLLNR